MVSESISPVGGSRLPRVLVLEDDPDTLVLLGKLLSKIPADALPAATCAAAHYGAKTAGPIDIIIADAHVPDGNGVELAVRLKEEFGCATVIMSGNPPPDSGFPCGVDEWIVKPVHLQQLEETVKKLAKA